MIAILPKATKPNCGVTLVELLVVVTILVLLLGVALPLARPAMEGRDVREAARQVSTFLMAAQAKAISTNRPVGVMLLRDTTNPNRCFQLALATTAAIYTGDDGSTRAVTAWNDDVGRWELGFKQNQLDTDPSINHVGLGQLVRPGETFEIRFDGRGSKYACTRLFPNGGKDTSISPRQDIAFPRPNGTDVGGFLSTFPANDPYKTNWRFPTPTGIPWRGGESTWEPERVTSITGLQFQVYRQPRRTAEPPLELPGGACVDLSLSGFAAGGVMPVTFPSDVGSGTRTLPNDLRYVMLTFDTSGALDSIYLPSDDDGNNEPDRLAKIAITRPLRFLIGRTEKVAVARNENWGSATRIPLRSDALEVDDNNNSIADFVEVEGKNENNLVDLGVYWVTIDHRNGNVTTSPNAGVSAALNALQSGELSELTLADAVVAARSIAATSIGVGAR